MINILTLYFISLFLDYPCQSEFLAKWKAKDWHVMWVHSFLWGFGVYLAASHLGFNDSWYMLVQLVAGHYIIDSWKAKGWYKKHNIPDLRAYHIDQFLHICQLLIVILG